MDRSAIAKEMLDKGVLLSPKALDDIVKERETITNPIVRVLYQRKKQESTTVAEINRMYTERYEFLRELLEKKADRHLLVSISKMSNGSRVSVIGMVRSVGSVSVIEDPTGIVNIKTNERLIKDEVVLVTGIKEKDCVAVDSVLYPDVPISHARSASKTIKCLFSASTMDDADIVIVKNTDGVVLRNGSTETMLRTPAILDVQSLRILVYETTKKDLHMLTEIQDPQKALTRLLKSRHLNPQSYDNTLLLKEMPDIICIFTDTAFTFNYKSTTIVAPLDKPCEIDLHTREVR